MRMQCAECLFLANMCFCMHLLFYDYLKIFNSICNWYCIVISLDHILCYAYFTNSHLLLNEMNTTNYSNTIKALLRRLSESKRIWWAWCGRIMVLCVRTIPQSSMSPRGFCRSTQGKPWNLWEIRNVNLVDAWKALEGFKSSIYNEVLRLAPCN